MPINNDLKTLVTMAAEFKTFKRRLPRFVGVLAVTFFKESFTRQGWVDKTLERWKERKDKGGKRGILIKAGALRRSIRIIQSSADRVRVGTMMVYAQIHNEGGTITQTPTKKQRKFFWAKFKETESDKWKHMAMAKTIKIPIPKRQFIGNSEGLNKRIARQIAARLTQILYKA